MQGKGIKQIQRHKCGRQGMAKMMTKTKSLQMGTTSRALEGANLDGITDKKGQRKLTHNDLNTGCCTTI